MPKPVTREPEDIARLYGTEPILPVKPAPEPYIPQQKPKIPRMIDESEPTYRPGETQEEKKKVSVPLIITLVCLLVLLLGLGGWFVYDHFLSPGTPDVETSDKSNEKDPAENENEEDSPSDSDGEASTGEEDTSSSDEEDEQTDSEEDSETDPETDPEEDTEEDTEEDFSLSRPADAVEWNGHYYYIYDSSAAGNWDDAKIFCEQKGGYLATISSAKEDRFLYELLVESGMKNAYFGYTDRNSEGTWRWANGETSSYTNCLPANPTTIPTQSIMPCTTLAIPTVRGTMTTV